MTKQKTRIRLLIAFGLICAMMVFLLFRVGWWQIVKADELSAQAASIVTKDSRVAAERGTIFDRNGEELAVSSSAYIVYVDPKSVLQGISSDATKEEKAKYIEDLSAQAAKIIGIDKKVIIDAVEKNKGVTRIAKGVKQKDINKLREAIAAGNIRGFTTEESAKRNYPLGNFASHLIGNVSEDNVGQSGVEQYYDSTLTGIAGRWVRNKDAQGKRLSYGKNSYYDPKNGSSIVLTIDDGVQNFVERYIQQTKKKTKAKRVMSIVMDVETGGILAMAVTPGYDPNDARTPLQKDKESYEAMAGDKQIEYLNKMWRNPLVSDVYEPGSTFKLITTSAALEEGIVNLNDTFYCAGGMEIAGTWINCWRYPNAHGAQTLKQAVANSCNPAMMQVGERLGIDKFYNYLDLFGITGTTGIDLPSEGTAILQDKESAGAVGLATISFGQGIAVTPIQLITAVSAIGNDGKMMRPHIVKAFQNSEGEIVEEYENQIVRQIISRKTSRQVCEIMEFAVTDGGVGAAAVDGYRIGGKTGTAYKIKKGGYSEDTDSSFIGLAPMEDPKVAVLVIVDSPKGEKYGSATAAPCGQQIYESILPYLGIQATEKKDSADLVKVPKITGENYSDAIGILKGKKLNYEVKSGNPEKDFKVTDQYPKPGTSLEKNSCVYIYGD